MVYEVIGWHNLLHCDDFISSNYSSSYPPHPHTSVVEKGGLNPTRSRNFKMNALLQTFPVTSLTTTNFVSFILKQS